MVYLLPTISYAKDEIIIDKNIVRIKNAEYYLYGYYINDIIIFNDFLYDDIDIPSIPMHAIKAKTSPAQMFKYGFEITAKDLSEEDFEIYWNMRLRYPTLTTNTAKKHLYEYRVVKGILIDYKKTSFAYSLHLETEDKNQFRLYIPQNSYNFFKFKRLKPYLGKEFFAVAQIEKWDNIVMQIHHPNQIVYKENNIIFRLFEKK